MRAKHILSVILTLTVVFIIGSCSDRGTNTCNCLEDRQEGQILTKGPGPGIFWDEFALQVGNTFAQVQAAAYVPKVFLPTYLGGEYRPVPVVILFPPQDGDHLFYFNHGLKEIADELISTGRIRPMAIVTFANAPAFGGVFAANSYPGAGNWDLFLDSSMLNFTYGSFVIPAINDPDQRGIGGIGMGGYAAFRAAMRNPGTYKSITVADGPYDFDLMYSLFDDALIEQGLLGGNIADFRSSGAWHLSRLFIGGALSFSPEDTAAYFRTTVNAQGNIRVTIDSIKSVTDPVQLSTLVSAVVTPGTWGEDFDFILPFDATGSVNPPVWNKWLAGNLENIHTPGSLNGTNIWVASSPESDFANFYDQTQSWISTLEAAGYPVETFEYRGYPGSPAQGDRYVYDLIKEMLIFHSESFAD